MTYREPKTVNAGDPYNYGGPEDAEANEFFAEQAKKEGKSVSGWMAENGLIGSALESRVRKHEVAASVLGTLIDHLDEDRSLEAYDDAVPGGQVGGSIITNGRVAFKVDMPKRRRGRPRKHFAKGESDGG
jgi:hypothetical protein